MGCQSQVTVCSVVALKIQFLGNLEKMLFHLADSKRGELSELMQKYICLFGDTPSRTDWVEHDIDVQDAQPIKQLFYRISPHKRKHLDNLENNIARPSTSSWASPCILVPKPDKTSRFCTDFRKVN